MRARLARKQTCPPGVGTDERKKLLIALLREARRLPTLSQKQGTDILEHACILSPTLSSSELIEIGKALQKVEDGNLEQGEL